MCALRKAFYPLFLWECLCVRVAGAGKYQGGSRGRNEPTCAEHFPDRHAENMAATVLMADWGRREVLGEGVRMLGERVGSVERLWRVGKVKGSGGVTCAPPLLLVGRVLAVA